MNQVNSHNGLAMMTAL